MAAHEVLLDLLGLALAQQPVVDEDAGQPVADGPLHQRGGDRGVDAAGQRRRSRGLVADLRADRLDRSSTMLSIVQDGRQPARVEEVLQHRLAVLGVQDLGVELHAVQAALGVLERGDRRLRRSRR